MPLWKKEREYLKKILTYKACYKPSYRSEDGYEPIVLDLLLNILVRLGDLLVVLSLLFGLLLFVAVKC